MRADYTYFLLTDLLSAGRKVATIYNVVTNTLNDQYGETQFSSMFEMRNQFSTLSKKYVVPGNMQDRPLLIKMTGSEGKSVTVWTKWQEMEFNFQWQKEKANQLMYSTINQNLDGTFTQKAPMVSPLSKVLVCVSKFPRPINSIIIPLRLITSWKL